ncbi:DUF4396 domain-containing protein [Spirosoma luteum]|uniref:P-type ATPase n=1 Tax=Spirosoma luteum TaxID=431553 RepID=UPI0003A21D29|nr:DUF4396 domain-containing protein [Spirosoma luteum]
MLPSDAHKVDGQTITDVQVDTLNKGDTVLVRPGERIPADGEVIEGSSAVNESMLFGFLTAYPLNWWLIKSGVKEKMYAATVPQRIPVRAC